LVATPGNVRQKTGRGSDFAAIAVKTPYESAASGSPREIVAQGLIVFHPPEQESLNQRHAIQIFTDSGVL